MGTYLITYDLMIPGQNYSDLISQIKQLDPQGWVKPCESVWIITTSLETEEIVKRLVAIDATDRIFVVSVSRPWWSQGLDPKVLIALKSKI